MLDMSSAGDRARKGQARDRLCRNGALPWLRCRNRLSLLSPRKVTAVHVTCLQSSDVHFCGIVESQDCTMYNPALLVVFVVLQVRTAPPALKL